MPEEKDMQQTGAGTENEPGADPKTPSFEDMLEQNPEYRSEFDRRLGKALETARGKWDAEKQEAVNEAQRLAKMTTEQKAKYEREQAEQALAQREAAVTRRELMAEAKSALASKGLPAELADCLNYADADTCKASMDAVEKAFQTAVSKKMDERLRQAPPKTGGGADSPADFSKQLEQARRDGNITAVAYYTRLEQQAKSQ